MTSFSYRSLFYCLLLLFCFTACQSKVNPTKSIVNESTSSADEESIRMVIERTLDLISGTKEQVRDFDSFRKQFTSDAIIGVSTNGNYLSFTVEEYIERNTPFFEKSDFIEKQLGYSISSYKSIGSVSQSYSTTVTDDEGIQLTSYGVNFYRMVKIEDEWKIQSILFTPASKEALPH